MTDVIDTAAREAVEEMKELFHDPANPPKDSSPYVESLKIVARTGAAGIAGTFMGCAPAVTQGILPAVAEGAEGVKEAFAQPQEKEEP